MTINWWHYIKVLPTMTRWGGDIADSRTILARLESEMFSFKAQASIESYFSVQPGQAET